MKKNALLLLACACPAAQAFSPSLESMKYAGEQQFLNAPRFAPVAFTKEPAAAFPWIGTPLPQDAAPYQMQTPGPTLGRVKLAAQLDRHRDLINRVLGNSAWDISIAGDAGFKNIFLTFMQGQKLIIRPLGDLKRLRSSDGVNVEIEPGLTYNFRVSINIFNPIRGSRLILTPAQGTTGPRHEIKTGVVVDAIQARSYVFNSGGVEYWMLYGTDVDPATQKLVDSRSFLFIHEDGTNTKGWQLAESALPVNKPVSVPFGDESFLLTRTAEGELLIQNAQLYSSNY